MAQVFDDQTFALPVGGVTTPIRTRQGFVLLKVTEHQKAGIPTLKEVEPQIEEGIYTQMMAPKLRDYLTKLREEASIDVAPGFVDSGASAKQTKFVYTAYSAPTAKKKTAPQKARLTRGSPSSGGSGFGGSERGSGGAAAGNGAGSGAGCAGQRCDAGYHGGSNGNNRCGDPQRRQGAYEYAGERERQAEEDPAGEGALRAGASQCAAGGTGGACAGRVGHGSRRDVSGGDAGRRDGPERAGGADAAFRDLDRGCHDDGDGPAGTTAGRDRQGAICGEG